MPPVTTEFAQWLVTLGVGGVLAAFMFVFYRKDIKQYTDLWKAVAENNQAVNKEMMQVIRENTASNAKLITLIENMERNQMRKSDLESLLRERDIERK